MSGSVWVVALALPCLTATAVTAVKAEAVVLRHRAEEVSDRAALAGADELALIGVAGACPGAARVAASDGAVLARCVITANTVRVVVRLGAELPVAGAVAVAVTAVAMPGGFGGLPAPEVPG
jgi:secretion/DNA translocation related TadE-like protein